MHVLWIFFFFCHSQLYSVKAPLGGSRFTQSKQTQRPLETVVDADIKNSHYGNYCKTLIQNLIQNNHGSNLCDELFFSTSRL